MFSSPFIISPRCGAMGVTKHLLTRDSKAVPMKAHSHKFLRTGIKETLRRLALKNVVSDKVQTIRNTASRAVFPAVRKYSLLSPRDKLARQSPEVPRAVLF